MFDINKCYDCFATEPNSAYFWSGLGENGQDIAAHIAQENGGTTLEMLMDKNKDELISAGFLYDEDLGGFYFSKENAQDWQAISQTYAEQASGNIHVVLGDNVREGSVWSTKELPALEKNNNVDKVISVDPTTGEDSNILFDKAYSNKQGIQDNINIANDINSSINSPLGPKELNDISRNADEISQKLIDKANSTEKNQKVANTMTGGMV